MRGLDIPVHRTCALPSEELERKSLHMSFGMLFYGSVGVSLHNISMSSNLVRYRFYQIILHIIADQKS